MGSQGASKPIRFVGEFAKQDQVLPEGKLLCPNLTFGAPKR